MSIIDEVIEYAEAEGMDAAKVEQATAAIAQLREIFRGFAPVYDNPASCSLHAWYCANLQPTA